MRKLTRRELIGGAFATAGTAVLAACSAPPAPTAAPAATTGPAQGGTPTQAGSAPAPAATKAPGAYTRAPKTSVQRERMVIGVQGLPSTMDPPNELSNVGTRVTYSVFDMPLRRDFFDNNKLVPGLATEWKRLDETTIELKLRQGVTFHNGDPLTSDDVKFTYDRLLKADTPFVEARTYFATFKEVQAPTPDTVRIVTKGPDPLLEQRLASWGSWVVPKKYVEKVGDAGFAKAPVGTGPFKVVKFDPADQLALERHDGYWDERPPVKQVVFRIIPENAARVTALINNEVQLITNIPPDQVAALKSAPNVEIRDIPLANMHVLRYNTKHPVLASEKLRQAMNLAIDRKLLVDTLWNGRAQLMHGHQFEEYGPLYNPSRPLLAFDLPKARQLVADSGYKGEKITYRTQADYYTNGLQAAQAIIAMWKDAGINAEILLVAAGDKEDPATSMVANWSNSSVLADPDGCLWRSWGKDSAQQKSYWTPDPEFNRLGEEARTTLDVKKRFDNYQKMLDIWEKEAPGTVLYAPVENYGVSKDVNWSPYPFYYMDLRAYNLSFNK